MGRQIQWRIKAFSHMENVDEDELFFTTPLLISEENIKNVKSEILQLIDKF
ncbi:MAG: hypothetical protein H6625_04655 [Bdellovibrionaceae bacterium]|nr:hypothetical protein [Pseudobdellovibrionaceae bacterium]